MKAFKPYAWAVEFGKDLRTLILEEPRALKYAADSHGIVKQLYELVEIPEPPKENTCDSPLL